MKIEIPEGFFPPPGVAFSTDAQVKLGCALHNAGFLRVQFCGDDKDSLNGLATPPDYRLAPPTPRKVGPFESVHVHPDSAVNDAWTQVMNAAAKIGLCNYRIHLTATAEEIL